jgi:hypothetical protein
VGRPSPLTGWRESPSIQASQRKQRSRPCFPSSISRLAASAVSAS